MRQLCAQRLYRVLLSRSSSYETVVCTAALPCFVELVKFIIMRQLCAQRPYRVLLSKFAET